MREEELPDHHVELHDHLGALVELDGDGRGELAHLGVDVGGGGGDGREGAAGAGVGHVGSCAVVRAAAGQQARRGLGRQGGSHIQSPAHR